MTSNWSRTTNPQVRAMTQWNSRTSRMNRMITTTTIFLRHSRDIQSRRLYRLRITTCHRRPQTTIFTIALNIRLLEWLLDLQRSLNRLLSIKSQALSNHCHFRTNRIVCRLSLKPTALRILEWTLITTQRILRTRLCTHLYEPWHRKATLKFMFNRTLKTHWWTWIRWVLKTSKWHLTTLTNPTL